MTPFYQDAAAPQHGNVATRQRIAEATGPDLVLFASDATSDDRRVNLQEGDLKQE